MWLAHLLSKNYEHQPKNINCTAGFQRASNITTSIDNRQHRMAFKLFTFKNIIGQGIASFAHQQSEHNLWMLVFAILRKACFAKFIFDFRFKVKSGDIVKDNT